MAVIKFPGRGNAVRKADDPSRACLQDEDEGDAAYGYGDGPVHDDNELGCEDVPTAPPYAPQARNRRLSPAELLARSLPGAALHRGRLTPTDVMAQALSPIAGTTSRDFLQQSFWEIWLQHQDYLKKKVSTSWNAAGRNPTTS